MACLASAEERPYGGHGYLVPTRHGLELTGGTHDPFVLAAVTALYPRRPDEPSRVWCHSYLAKGADREDASPGTGVAGWAGCWLVPGRLR
jgi:hypothetical protein